MRHALCLLNPCRACYAGRCLFKNLPRLSVPDPTLVRRPRGHCAAATSEANLFPIRGRPFLSALRGEDLFDPQQKGDRGGTERSLTRRKIERLSSLFFLNFARRG